MQGMFAAQAARSEPPSTTISRVNLALYRRGIESRFVTLMYGALEDNGEVDLLQRRPQSTADHQRQGGQRPPPGMRRPGCGLFEARRTTRKR